MAATQLPAGQAGTQIPGGEPKINSRMIDRGRRAAWHLHRSCVSALLTGVGHELSPQTLKLARNQWWTARQGKFIYIAHFTHSGNSKFLTEKEV